MQAGTELAVELKEAETAAARAQSEAISARFEAARARIRLAYVVGVAHPESVVELAGAASGRKFSDRRTGVLHAHPSNETAWDLSGFATSSRARGPRKRAQTARRARISRF